MKLYPNGRKIIKKTASLHTIDSVRNAWKAPFQFWGTCRWVSYVQCAFAITMMGRFGGFMSWRGKFIPFTHDAPIWRPDVHMTL